MAHEMNRRQALAGLGAVSLGALLAACNEGDDGGAAGTQVETSGGGTTTVEPKTDASLTELFDNAPSCSLTPEQTEGPFYFDADSIRSDIRAGREGERLRLALRVRDSDCRPLPDAVVDIWQCDALGEYSTEAEPFLRGAQATNADGIVQFKTLYPGWYMGRTVHVHAKVHVDRETALTTQLYFDDDVTDKVFEREPYSRRAERDQRNESDGIFEEQTVLKLAEDGDGHLGVLNLDVEAA